MSIFREDFKNRHNDVAQNPGLLNTVGVTNRGEDNAFTSQDAPPINITLERINDIIISYFRDRVAPTIQENNVTVPVPVEYGTPERWIAIRRDGGLKRDPNDAKLQTPLIVLHRSREERGQLKNPNNKYMYETVMPVWNNRNAYSKYNIQNGVVPSTLLRTVLVPDYMDLTYDVIIWTSYQSQMDHLIEQINFEAEEYWGERNNYKFRVMIEDYSNITQLPATADRTVRSEFSMKIGAYLLPEKALVNFKPHTTSAKTYAPKKAVFTTYIVQNGINIPID